ncbi:MAG: AAA family ATPase [Pirellulales bacterium]|nr:AAA family ATPase [Pirellulales bacterium]
MKILALKIDGYGIWSGLRIERFSDGLNVLYGPNEAGKTTLLQFIRSMLYGYSESRRQYFPPVHGGRPGGMAEVDSPQGRYEIARHWLPPSGGEEIVLTASDGMRQGEHLVKAMLSEVDEAIFNNVFAVELREMQELGALGDTAAAELLYNLTAGLDRVSLVEALRELDISRNRILDAGGGSSLLANLRGRREKLLAEIEQLGGLTRRFGLLIGERSQLERDLARLEEEQNQLERQSRTQGLAAALRDRWWRRSAIDGELAVLGPIAPLPDKMLERIDALNAQLQRHRGRIAELRRERGQLRNEAANLAINEDLLKQFARIEALREQESWFAGLQARIGELEAEIVLLENESAGLWKPLGLNEGALARSDRLSRRSFAALRSPAKNLRRLRDNLDRARAEAKAAQEASESLAEEIAAALAARSETNLNDAMDKTGQTVAQCRRRLQIDERFDQLARHRKELEEQNQRAVERQLLPTWVLAGLGTVFVLGALLICAGLVLPLLLSRSTDWMTAGLGVIGIIGTAFGKFALERANAKRMDACQKQLALVQSQIEQLLGERDALDARLPRGGGPLASRLEAAENDLSELENLVPLETRRNAAMQSAAAAGERAAQLEAEYRSARRKWRDLLAAAGLPVELSARQVRQLAGRWSGMSETGRRLAQCREELDRRRKEADALSARLLQVAADAKLALPDGNPLERLKLLANLLAEEQAAAERKEAVRGRIKQFRRLRARHEEAIGRLNHRRRRLFFEAGAEDEDSFREKALQSARGESLRRERETLRRDIAAAIGAQCSEEAVRELLEGAPAGELESRGNLLRDRLAMLDTQVRERLEKRGQLTAQIQALAEDRRLPRLQLDLAAVERQIAEAARRWQVLAVVCRALENIRASYEHERQPETLKEASVHLARLTRGRYCRVWTPLGEKTLRVDDAHGHCLPVEALSRGTREQLFLSLRLALCASYARRGAALPMILDDVLVNFDADRAVAAAEVLRDFAAAGHQLLVCTCHEHIEKIFALLGAPSNRLPAAFQPGGATIAFQRVAPAEVPKREKPRPSPRRKAVVKTKAPEEDFPPDCEDLPEEESVSPPVARTPVPAPTAPLPPPPKKTLFQSKKGVKSSGVFDVDFFDSEEEANEIAEELEDIEEDRSLWQDDGAATHEVDDEFNEADYEGNGEAP